MKSRLTFVAFGIAGLVAVAVMAATQTTPAAKPAAAPVTAAAATPKAPSNLPPLTQENATKICYGYFQDADNLKNQYNACLKRHAANINKPLTRGDAGALTRLNKAAPVAGKTLTQDDSNKICYARFQDAAHLKKQHDDCTRRLSAVIGKPMSVRVAKSLDKVNRAAAKKK